MQATETCQPQQSQSQWIDGIELLRAIAVALVAVSHGFDLINNWNNPVSDFMMSCFSTFLKPGWWGVRIFFAISGYLIASQSIKVIHKGSPVLAKNFALRRWIRTVPTYWIFLLAITLFSGASIFTEAFRDNAFFLQTIADNSSIIGVGWSLVIEEWSYAIISVFLLLITFFTSSKSRKQGAQMLAGLALFLLVVATLFRYQTCLSGDGSWETLKRNPFLQLDALSMGVFLACIQTLYPNWLDRVLNQAGYLVLAAILGMNLTGWWINASIVNADTISTQTWLTLGLIIYPICSFLSALLVLGCFRYESSKIHAIPRKLIQVLATTSYSIYLIHLYVLQGLRGIPLFANSGAAFWIYLLCSTLAGIAAFELTEKPFFQLRKRFRTN
ncbi:MAG: acyltransferase family protein [Synechococcus sp. s2_metabat2_7]|nr:acyltransferase family protein [Synechococcus sp. s2_metabat2_7]